MGRKKSHELFARANEYLVGGVNSPVRAFKGVGGNPFFVRKGKGALITDVDGNEYIDYVLSWGPLVLGHAHPEVVEAVTRAAEKGASFGISTGAEVELAEALVRAVPSMEKVRLVSSGTEATMSAIRLARGYTGRDLIVKVEGCYHGHVDGLLVKAGSGLATFGTPDSKGIPEAYARCTLTMPFNDLPAATELFGAHGHNIAAIIVEPLPGNMGVVHPAEGYLDGLRALTREHDALLIFDEVMSGFRAAPGGMQQHAGTTPDLTTLGKVIGGGLPVGAYGGRAEIMLHLSPEGPVYQAGTLSGNPLATAAGLKTLEIIQREGMFEATAHAMTALSDGIAEIAAECSIPVFQQGLGSMGCTFFQEGPVCDYAGASQSDTARYAKFFWGMLERGVYFAPSQYEACFTSTAHTDGIIGRTLEAARDTFRALN